MLDIHRVLLVGPLEGARWRSISAYASSLREMLQLAGVEVETATAPWFNPPSLVDGLRQHWTRQAAIRRAEEGAYDLVHLTDHALGHHVARFRRHSAVVVTCHDLMPFTVPGYYRSKREAAVKRAFLRRPQRLMCRADGLIAVSQFTRAEVASRYGVLKDDITVVPNVVRPAFHPAPRAQAEAVLAAAGIVLPPGPRVVSVGHRQGYKNLPALFEALARPALAHVQLVRAGAMLSPKLLQQAEALGVRRRITELGSITDEQLAAVYAASDVLAQPSLGEGFGIPVIEAMACGLPVVTSNGGALPEVVGDAAVVVELGEGFPARFAASLATAISRRGELSAAGLFSARQYRPEAVAPGLLAAYQLALARKSAAE